MGPCPLRYAGETFYQSGFDDTGPRQRKRALPAEGSPKIVNFRDGGVKWLALEYAKLERA